MAIKTYYLLKRYIDTAEKNLPFYVEDVSGQSATLTLDTQYSDATNIEYSTDNVTWSSTKPSIPANGRVYIRANATHWGSSSVTYYSICKSNMNYNAGGNIMSLFYGSLFTGTETAFPDNTVTDVLRQFFGGNINNDNKIVSVEKLALPATTLVERCYYSMFSNCKRLQNAPALPATTLAKYCYTYMFVGCHELPNAPALPATTLADYCYQQMFYDCTSLTTAPALPATTLAQGCYQAMFWFCSNLNSITVGATSWDTSNSSGWVTGVAATGTFTKPSTTTIATGDDGIPSGWTVVNV